ncbi:hypothetical protein BTM25_15930 [Actinomadura rubteroloni]|uniref:Hemerythrin-like domain-containing protein n=1 Tax=Actinomadura rubteroloni TaxID=1926885 RepID=A0A2P4UQ64_9ACTN|nr:hemerythrin domain-containing protein [Actinomadura rubteroloni]POM27182.1 hypothetical protein BTM25_15930 [Actinomadura rubteroloni]
MSDQKIDTSMMYAVHDAFQRDMDRFAGLAERGAALDGPDVAACWTRFTRFLHIHHTAEDTHLWPVLQERVAGGPGEAVLERMEREHRDLTALLDAFQHDPERHAGRLRAAMTEHCEHEEELALPLVQNLLTPDEWNAFGDEQRRRLGIGGAASFFPWLLDGADETARRSVLGHLPPPVRIVYRAVWRPRYLRGPRLPALAGV